MSSVLRQSAVIAGLGWLLTPFSFLTSVLVSRWVGPEGRGVLFLLSGLTAIATTLTGFGLASAAPVLYRQKRLSAGEIMGATLALGVLSLALVVGSYLAFSDIFLQLFLADAETVRVPATWVLLALAPVLPTGIVTVGDVLLIAENSMRQYALRNVGSSVLALGLTWLLTIHLGYGIQGVLWAQLGGSVFGMSVVLTRWLGRVEIRSWWRTSRDLLSIGLQQYPVALVSLVTKRFDAFLLASVLSVRDAGYFAIASSVQALLLSIPRSTMWPLVARLSTDPNDDVLPRACRLQIAVIVVVTAMVWLLAPWLVELAFGAQFAPAVNPIRWAVVAMPFAPIAIAVSAYLTARGEPRRIIVPTAVSGLVQVCANLLLVPLWGPTGSAVSMSLALACFAVFQLAALRALRPMALNQFLMPRPADVASLTGLLRRRNPTAGQ